MPWGRSLSYWREVHESSLKEELFTIGHTFDGSTRVVCEEFEVIYA